MRLSYNELSQILNDFPSFELSYEKKLHKKVQSDVYLTIPKGKKYFAWFKLYKNNPICFFLEINRKNKSIESVENYQFPFRNELCAGKGTVLYGTVFFVNKKRCFNIENIYYLKGNNMKYANNATIIKEMYNLMQNYVKQTYFNNNSILMGLPMIDTNYYNLLNKINNLYYDIFCIQYRLLYKNKPYMNELIKINKQVYKYFLIKPTIINDIYDLYVLNDNKYEKFSNAYIPDYKCSVMMNSLFRNIKENNNLDALEESDDEEEFENISLDKFVDLDRKYIMKCLYLPKFKSWKPIEVVNEKVSQKREILFYKKK
tara:strand:+ start:20695 stop:21639 length:945 start_codon:yes stop_codon:yes gene_type:complete